MSVFSGFLSFMRVTALLISLVCVLSCSRKIIREIVPAEKSLLLQGDFKTEIKSIYFDSAVYYADKNSSARKFFSNTVSDGFLVTVTNVTETFLPLPQISLVESDRVSRVDVKLSLSEPYRQVRAYTPESEISGCFISYKFNFILPEDTVVFFAALPELTGRKKLNLSVKMVIGKREKIVDFEYMTSEYRKK